MMAGRSAENGDWIQNLAQAEWVPEVDGHGRGVDVQQLIEESTIEWLRDLRDLLFDYARQFNALSQDGTKYPDVKVYQIAQTAADFMLFRNQVKLTITNPHHGVIQFAFSRHARSGASIDGQMEGTANFEGGALHPLASQQELVAQLGPFRDVEWMLGGEAVALEKVAQFYFSEFVRTSRPVKRAKTQNQVLLDQIRGLLQEKGLDL